MKERPILFSGPMVRALLEGRKTQTRRVMKPQPAATMTRDVYFPTQQEWCFTGPQRDAEGNELPVEKWEGGWPDCGPNFPCPYGKPGDRLWVRETWTGTWLDGESRMHLVYAADGSELACEAPDDFVLPKAAVKPSNWVTPLFMPSWASRITLEVTEVRVQRLQEISEEDAIAEGSQIPIAELKPSAQQASWSERQAYSRIWESINGPGSWHANPWVWAITFSATQERAHSAKSEGV